MKTTITENNLRFGGNVPLTLQAAHIRTRATAAFQTIIIPFLIERLGEDSVVKMVRGTIFKITIHDVELPRDQLENTAGAGVRAGIGDVAHGRIPFRRIAYDGYVFSLLLNQNTFEADELHWQLTAHAGDRKIRTEQPVTQPTSPPPKQVERVERPLSSIPQSPPVSKPVPIAEPVATPPTPTILPRTEATSANSGSGKITPQELHALIPILEKLMRKMSA